MPGDGTKIRESSSRGLRETASVPSAGRAPLPVESWQPPYCGDIGLKIRADGQWLYQGSPIRREALVRLFSSVLRKDADGRTYLVTPAEKIDMAVEDAPFLAVAMEVRGKGRAQELTFTTNVGHRPAPPAAVCHAGARRRLETLPARARAARGAAHARARLRPRSARGRGPREGRSCLGVWSAGAFFPMDG